MDLSQYDVLDGRNTAIFQQYTDLCDALDIILIFINKNIRGFDKTEAQLNFGDTLLHLTLSFLDKGTSKLIHSLQDMEENESVENNVLIENGTEILKKVAKACSP